MKDHDKFEAMDILCKADIPAGALLDCADITNDPQYYERGIMVEVEHPERGKVKVPGFAQKLSENHVEYECSPALGGSNEEVYKGMLGLTDEQFESFKSSESDLKFINRQRNTPSNHMVVIARGIYTRMLISSF